LRDVISCVFAISRAVQLAGVTMQVSSSLSTRVVQLCSKHQVFTVNPLALTFFTAVNYTGWKVIELSYWMTQTVRLCVFVIYLTTVFR
jgi:hypothetical protein